MKTWIVGLVLAAAPCAALAQDQWAQEVEEQLRLAAEEAGGDGWVLSHDILQDSLNDGETHSVDLELDGGYAYGFIAVCDSDCNDIDMSLHDASGSELVSDTASDPLALLDFVPETSGTYSIAVRMYSCSAEPCRYGVAVFTQ